MILDAEFNKAKLNKFIKDQLNNFTEDQCTCSLNLLQEIEEMFEGTLGTYKQIQ